jgi:hypothetical protein
MQPSYITPRHGTLANPINYPEATASAPERPTMPPCTPSRPLVNGNVVIGGAMVNTINGKPVFLRVTF